VTPHVKLQRDDVEERPLAYPEPIDFCQSP